MAVTRLTGTGRKLAELPVDPRLGRMILESGRNGCVREVLIITAALAIQDPRERPADVRDAADAMHRRFAEPGSDFLALVTLWDYLRGQQRQSSSSAFRRMCRREYLHFLRVREWQDVYSQLQQAARELGIVAGRERGTGQPAADEPAAGEPAAGKQGAASGQQSADDQNRKVYAAGKKRRRPGCPAAGLCSGPPRPARRPQSDGRYSRDLADRVHQSLLAGLLSHIGMQDGRPHIGRPQGG